jgi:hypothetical protein
MQPPETRYVRRAEGVSIADLVVGSGSLVRRPRDARAQGRAGEWRVLAVDDGRAVAREPIERHSVGPGDRLTVSLARRAPRAARVAQRLTRR